MANVKRQGAEKEKLPPTLIIGMGGTGCEIAERVYRLANDEQRQYIRFVYFDTDANELRGRKEKTPQAKTVQTSRKITVGQALRNDIEAQKYSFPVNNQLLNKPLTEGAGQVRAISKLAFDMCLREGRLNELHEAIGELLKLNGDSMEQTMRVVIISTLVGGTGSGILLPVSMYVRNYLENTCQKKHLIRGFCVLPDVFFHGNKKSETEKNNLRANAYAALRELDAFMLKSDSTWSKDLSRKYWLKMPRPGTVGEYDDYAVSPMDFCFLFDGQNMDGDGLDNFSAYIQHAADCVYASSVSLMNKRLNSSEDNTILQRCAENGRNRYCGLGTSKIIYPYESVRDYIAMQWMNQSMTEDWLRYDKAIGRKMAQQQISKSHGVVLPPINKREEYCRLVESGVSEENVFSLSIQEECFNRDKLGISFTTPKWETYYGKLKAYTDEQAGRNQYDGGMEEKINATIAQLSTNSAEANSVDFVTAFTGLTPLLKAYFSKTKRYAEDTAGIVADEIFSPSNFNAGLEHHLEHWLMQDDAPYHPNTIRYFLYSLEMLLKEEKRQLETRSDRMSEAASDYDGEESSMSFADVEVALKHFFDAKTYTIESGDQTVNVNIEAYVNSIRKKSMFGKGDKKDDMMDKMEQVLGACREYVENVKKYYSSYLRLTIIKEALEYINRLSDNYEYFFQQLDIEINRIPRRIKRIEESFANNPGSPVMYACASVECLRGLSERCPNIVDSILLTSDFRKELFDGIFKVGYDGGEEQRRMAIDKFVENDILEFWRDEVQSQYAKKVDMDIIDALRTEAEIEKSKYDKDEQKYYIRKKHEEALKLAAPFIDRPIGREPYIIEACVLSSDVVNTDDMLKSAYVREIFDGCEKDPLLEKNQALFMKAMYNLRISDLPKFAPEDHNPVDPHKEGDYYKAYWSRIDNVLPDSNVTKILTPHLDKRWHYIGVMPDLSEESEARCTAEAQEAFLVCIAYAFVSFDKDQYKFIDKNGDFIKDSIIVEDGKCNKMHELLEAMMMSRPLVRNMLVRFEEMVKKEESEQSVGNKNYQYTQLYNQLGSVRLHAYPQIEHMSIFDLPILNKISSGNSEYNDDESIEMVQNYMNFLEKYLSRFYSDNFVRNEYLMKWLAEQAELLIGNLDSCYRIPGAELLADPFNDSLVNRVYNVLLGKIRTFENVDGYEETVQHLKDKWTEFGRKS